MIFIRGADVAFAMDEYFYWSSALAKFCHAVPPFQIQNTTYFLQNQQYWLCYRWGQPGQQQGRRFPLISSSRTRSMCCFLVSGFFTDVVQQIHSLRASGVSVFQASRAFGEERSAFFMSAGTLCTTPFAIFDKAIGLNVWINVSQRVLHFGSSMVVSMARCSQRTVGCQVPPRCRV